MHSALGASRWMCDAQGFKFTEAHMPPEINTVLLIALMPAVLGFVNFFKSLGLEGKALNCSINGHRHRCGSGRDAVPTGIFQWRITV